jgi:hypothetical protein
MKKLVYLFFALLIFACSSDDSTTCLVCTDMNFTIVSPTSGTTFSCDDFEGEEICEGETRDALCFSIPARNEPLTMVQLNKIKLFWESKGATCIFKVN